MEASQSRAAVAGIVIGVLVAVGFGGLTMTGYINPELGWTLVAVGFGGALWVAIRTWGPRPRSQSRQLKRRARAVAADLHAYINELDQLYHQSKGDPSGDTWSRLNLARERADELLKPWKSRLLEYLDANIDHQTAIDLWRLGDMRNDGAPGAHVKDSYERHREHLKRIAAEVELGEIRVKWPPQRSGESPPPVESFVSKPRTER